MNYPRLGAAICLAALVIVSAACADTVTLAFHKDGQCFTATRAIERPATPAAAVELLLQGPTPDEAALGVSSAIPTGTALESLDPTANGAIVNLSQEAVTGLNDAKCDLIFRQFVLTLAPFGLDANVRVMVGGQPLSSYLPPTPAPVYQAPVEPVSAKRPVGGVGLSGKRITVSPGHGWTWQYYMGYYWQTQRGTACTYPCEDFNDLDIATWLVKYLEGDGAYVQRVREHDKTRGNGPSGHPWWQEAAYVYLKDAGYDCGVYASSSGVCQYEGTADHATDDVRCRGLASNLDARGNTDIFLSIHTNSGGGTAKGTTVWYCDTGEHVAWGPASITLCDEIGAATIAAIAAAGEKCADGTTWGCLGNVCTRYGDLGEARIPARPAALMELGFHDNCTADAPKLHDAFFQSVAMWGEYKGVCDYFGVTPTWDMMSDEIVSHNIPTTMSTGQTVTATITLRNRGILWQSAKGFKLSAVGGSDPFTLTLDYAVGTDTGPGDTYSFNIVLHAPSTAGYYLTDWRMQRTGYGSFGPTISRNINVGLPPDTQAPTVPTDLAAEVQSTTQVNLTWTASTDNVSVAGYKIYRGGALIGTSITTTYADTTCSPDVTYSYRVSAFDDAGNESAQCTAINVTTPFDTDIIVDEESATVTGSWTAATATPPAAYGGDYKYTLATSTETATAIFRPTIVRPALYDVYVYYRSGENRTQHAPYTVYYSGGSQLFTISQEAGGGAWVYLGRFAFASGTAGYVKLGNNASDTGEVVVADAVRFLYISDTQSAPSITTQPTPQSVCTGGSATFTLVAGGTAPLAYQWRKGTTSISNGGHYSGATTASLVIAGADSGDAATNYNCVVTNSYGSATTNDVALTIVSATTITAHPTPQTVTAGATATFTVAASGSGLTYQWQKNTVNLSNGGDMSGATSATLGIANCEETDEGSYRCVVTGCGTATSNAATLTVNPGASGELLVNGGFENALGSEWTAYSRTATPVLSRQTSGVYCGTYYLYEQLTTLNTAGGVRQTVTGTSPGATYLISGARKSVHSDVTVSVKVDTDGGTDYNSAEVTVVSGVTTVGVWSTFSQTVTATGSSMTIFLDSSQSGGVSSSHVGAFDCMSLAATCSASVPGAPTVAQVDSTTLSVANNAGDSSSSYYAFRINDGSACSNKFVQSNGTVGTSPVWQTKGVWGTKNVTGLTASTSYTFDVAAAADSSGSSCLTSNRYPGSYVGSPTLGVANKWASGDTAATFNGTSQYVALPAMGADVDLSTGFTIECWANPSAVSTWYPVIQLTDSTSYGTFVNHICFDMSSTGGMRGEVYRSGGCGDPCMGNYYVSPTLSFTTGSWHHYAMVVSSGGTLTFYKDGAADAGQSLLYMPSSGVTRGKVQIGRRDTTTSNYWHGSLDEVALYDYALSGTQISAHCAAADAAIYNTQVVKDNPVAYWRLGEASGTAAADNKGGYSESTTQTTSSGCTPVAVAPTSATANPSTICYGASSTLTAIGGSGTTCQWYTGTCGGTLVGTGTSITVSPTSTTTYYVRWTNSCGSSTCKTTSVTVNPLPVAPASASANPTSIAPGGTSTLTATGGSGTTCKWYTGSCGGTLVGTGTSITVSPTSATTYYARWENTCGNSTCATTTVSITPAPTVTAITPRTGPNTGTTNVTSLAGTGFVSGATVKLKRTGQTDIAATGVSVVSPTQITCSLGLSGKKTGLWDVVVTNPDAQYGILVNGFGITIASTAPVVGTSIESLLDSIATTAGAARQFCVWGKVQTIDSLTFWLDDGSGTQIKVFAPGYTGITTGNYISAIGSVDLSVAPPVLISSASRVRKY